MATPTKLRPHTSLEVLSRDDKLRRNPTVYEPLAQNNRQTPALLWNGAAATGPGVAVNVVGRYYHAVQAVGIAGSDAFSIQGSIDGINFVTVGTSIAANGITQFTGLFSFLLVNKTAGTGTTSVVSLLSMAP